MEKEKVTPCRELSHFVEKFVCDHIQVDSLVEHKPVCISLPGVPSFQMGGYVTVIAANGTPAHFISGLGFVQACRGRDWKEGESYDREVNMVLELIEREFPEKVFVF